MHGIPGDNPVASPRDARWGVGKHAVLVTVNQDP